MKEQKGDETLLKKRNLILSCFGLSLASILTGCSSITPQKNAPTEAVTEAVPVVLQSESQQETSIQTESAAKKEESLKDIQVSIEKSDRAGTASLQIDDPSGTKEITQSYRLKALI